jgi:hypothetical protein
MQMLSLWGAAASVPQLVSQMVAAAAGSAGVGGAVSPARSGRQSSLMRQVQAPRLPVSPRDVPLT